MGSGLLVLLIAAAALAVVVDGFNPFVRSAHKILGGGGLDDKPMLVLISGSPGTGKSTFGMSVALDQGILKCVSTDTIRATMRSFVSKEVSPALHRSSYTPAFEDDDPVRSWKETCHVLERSVETLVEDAMERRVSLVVEGVHLIPNRNLIELWEQHGGVALGCLLQISDAATHQRLLQKRGYMTGNMTNEKLKIQSYDRIRAIQDEMIRCADESGWLRIEQKTELDPLEMVSATLLGINVENFDGVGEEDDDYFENDNHRVPGDGDVQNHIQIEHSNHSSNDNNHLQMKTTITSTAQPKEPPPASVDSIKQPAIRPNGYDFDEEND